MTASFRFRTFRRFISTVFVFTVSAWILYLSTASNAGNRDARLSSNNDEQHNVILELNNETVTSNSNSVKILALRELVSKRNRKAVERLEDLLKIKVFRYVIIVQIHDRVTYIKAMLESLAAVREIQDALLILSHDVVNQEVDNVPITVKTNFEVVQIYFPHSPQLYPDSFPGASPLDCPNGLSKAEATKRQCVGYDHPDSYGHYRSPRLTQVKHHWWWKFHFVFTNVPSAQANVPVIFVEDDHYFLPDALYVLDQLLVQRETACDPRCAVVSVAHHKVKLASEPEAHQRYFAGQWANGDNIGIVFDHDFYQLINSCAEMFCHVDDYNWDWSLYFVISRCLKKDYQMIMPVAPRVLHIGNCGGVHLKATCDPSVNVRSARESVRDVTEKLFPANLTKVTRKVQSKPKNPGVNGGWGDPRDRELCDKMLNQTDVSFSVP